MGGWRPVLGATVGKIHPKPSTLETLAYQEYHCCLQNIGSTLVQTKGTLKPQPFVILRSQTEFSSSSLFTSNVCVL